VAFVASLGLLHPQILSLKVVPFKGGRSLGLEGTNHKFRHSFCTIAVLSGVNFFTLRRWVGHIDEEALKIYVHIADEEAQVTMRQLAERRQAAGRAAKPARGRKGISKVSAQSPRGGRGAGG
jgi:hypothetical protein